MTKIINKRAFNLQTNIQYLFADKLKKKKKKDSRDENYLQY